MEYRQYRDTELKTSLLGLGCMRFPTKDRMIDYEAAEKIIDYAYANGINYFDSAYNYGMDGDSERTSGKALSKYPRESYNIATKLPPTKMDSPETIREAFNEQLERWGVEYFDFYLMHNLSSGTIDTFSQPHVIATLLELKAEGKLRKIGFSSHADPETLERFLKHYKWDFAQMQFNYFDWTYQNAKRQYELFEEYGVPIMVMEPVRGGKLSSVTPEADAMLKEYNPEASISSWALRYAAGFPNVQVVLSGMSAMEQIIDNVGTISNFKPLNDEEHELVMKAAEMLKDQALIPCTKCEYCVATCPSELNIPYLLGIFNNYKLGPSFFQLLGIKGLPEDKRPSACVACGVCTEKCPQNIEIPEVLAEFAEIFKNTKFPG